MQPIRNLVNSALKSSDKAPKGNPTDDGTPKTVTYWDEERNEKRSQCIECDEILHRGPPCRCQICGAYNFDVLSDDEASKDKTKPCSDGSSSNNNKDDKNKNKNKNKSKKWNKNKKNSDKNRAIKDDKPLDQDWQNVTVYRPNQGFYL